MSPPTKILREGACIRNCLKGNAYTRSLKTTVRTKPNNCAVIVIFNPQCELHLVMRPIHRIRIMILSNSGSTHDSRYFVPCITSAVHNKDAADHTQKTTDALLHVTGKSETCQPGIKGTACTGVTQPMTKLRQVPPLEPLYYCCEENCDAHSNPNNTLERTDRSARELSVNDFEQKNEINRNTLYEQSPFAAELEVTTPQTDSAHQRQALTPTPTISTHRRPLRTRHTETLSASQPATAQQAKGKPRRSIQRSFIRRRRQTTPG